MIQSSSRKRHSSAEAASQTVPQDECVFRERNVMKLDIDSLMAQSMNEKQDQVQHDKNSEAVCGKEQAVQNTKQNNDSRNDFSETCLLEDFEHGVTDKNKDIAENRRKSRRNSSPKLEGKPKKEKVVPDSVRRHLNKESIIDTDQSSSSQVDSVTFNQDVILASSPKKKTGAQKKKKSPKKKGGKINLNTFKENSSTEIQSNNASKQKTSGEEEKGLSDKDAHNVKPDFGNKIQQKVVDNNVTKNEGSEISNEATIRSSEISILENELTEMMATESSDMSTTSAVKSSSSRKQETNTQLLNKEDSYVRTASEHSQKSQSDSVENCGATFNVNHDQTCEKSDIANGEMTPGETTECSVLKGDNPNNDLLTSGTLLTGKITPVIVSEIISPWCFFVQKNGPELNKLMEQIG